MIVNKDAREQQTVTVLRGGPNGRPTERQETIADLRRRLREKHQ
jgi:hypothetical protein